MRGNITRRGRSSWRLKFDVGADPVTGGRVIQYQTVRGTKKDAQVALAKRLAEFADGRFVKPTAQTVASYARHWLEAIASANTSAKTVERYRSLIEVHIIPGLGEIALQQLDGDAIDQFYSRCRADGRRDGKALSSLSVHHIHRLLSQLLSSAVKARKIRQSPMIDVQTTPKAKRSREIQVLNETELANLLSHLKGGPLYMPTLLAASTGMRRGEVLGVRWSDINLDNARLQVTQAVEIVAGNITLKSPKTERSRRAITLPATILPALRSHRKEQAELRLKLGLGKDPDDLVFTEWDGQILNPTNFSRRFKAAAAAAADLPELTFHGLRHTHITHLLRRNVPVHVVSARAGHATPSVTLNTYAHLLDGQQEAAAAVADAFLRVVID